jgi:dolichol-phosphate mannosyltransferase
VRGVPVLRRLTALGAVMLFKLVHPVRGVWDYTCGYRGYRVGVLKNATDHYRGGLVQENGFACMVEVLLKMNALKCRFAEIPLQLRYDLKPTDSKMDVSGNIVRLLRLLVGWRWRGFDAS